jgi:hypothetical protein
VRSCCLNVEATDLLLQSVGLGFLGFPGTLDVSSDAHLIVQKGFLGVYYPHGKKRLKSVFFPSDDCDLLAMVLDLGQDVLEFIL